MSRIISIDIEMASAESSSSGPSVPSNRGPTRQPSFPRPSTANEVLSTVDKRLPTSPLVKHGKYVLVGTAGCWWVGLPDAVRGLLESERGWVR